MAKENLPPWIKDFWTETPTEYTSDDIHHLEPDSELAVHLKYLIENGFAKLVFKLNGEVIGEFNGSDPTDLDLVLGNLAIQRNGTNIGTYNGSDDSTVNIQVPNITYGTSAPTGGSTGDVYMRYLA